MIGKIYISSTGYDPENGKHINDPYLDGEPSLGACRPDIREAVETGDYNFAITGKLPVQSKLKQFVFCGFEVVEKIDALEAYYRFPRQRLNRDEDGKLVGNIIVDKFGRQHPLDNHDSGKIFIVDGKTLL